MTCSCMSEYEEIPGAISMSRAGAICLSRQPLRVPYDYSEVGWYRAVPRNGMEEVVGSIPTRSTIKSTTCDIFD